MSCIYQLLAETQAKDSATQTQGFGFTVRESCPLLAPHEIGILKGHICCPGQISTKVMVLDQTPSKASTFMFSPQEALSHLYHGHLLVFKVVKSVYL